MAQAQWWQDAGLPLNQAWSVTQIYEDTATSTLYCAGQLEHVVTPPLQSFHYCAYRNGEWSRSVPFDNNVFTVINYHDTLIVGGMFSHVDGEPITHIAAFYDGAWHPFGNMSSTVRALRVLDGELYALGSFRYADGHWCGGVAKRVGGGWVNVGHFELDGVVLDAVFYEGRLVVTGTFSVSGQTYKHILKYDGESWNPVGLGILGSIAGGGLLAVYQGDLYVAGVIPVNAGNAGHGIMRWDGESFHAVGTGFQDVTGGQSYTLAVTGLTVKDGLLFTCGGYRYAGNVPAASHVATWDGRRWCALGGSLDPEVGAFSLGFFGDTLFVSSGQVADGQPVNRLVRFIGEDYADTCSVPMGPVALPEQPTARAGGVVHLGGGAYLVQGGMPGGEGPLRVHGLGGQLVHTEQVRTGADGEVRFHLNGLSPAVYVVSYKGMRVKVVVAGY